WRFSTSIMVETDGHGLESVFPRPICFWNSRKNQTGFRRPGRAGRTGGGRLLYLRPLPRFAREKWRGFKEVGFPKDVPCADQERIKGDFPAVSLAGEPSSVFHPSRNHERIHLGTGESVEMVRIRRRTAHPRRSRP